MERGFVIRLALALGAAAVLANLPGAADRGWPIALFRAALWLAVLVVLAADGGGFGPIRKRAERTIVASLAVLAAFAFAVYGDFGRLHGHGAALHRHELYNYVIGSKYFPELGYDGHYLATHRALVDNDPAYFDSIELVQNLRTHRLEGRVVSLQRSESVAARFTAARWDEMRADVAFFQRTLPPETWPFLMVDHGYNATPFWTMLGRVFSTRMHLQGGSLELLASLDLLLLAVTLGLAAWGFGRKAALLFAIFYLAGFSDAFAFTGGAFLRLLWLAGVVGFAACLRRGRPVLAGVLLGAAALDRIFPALLIVVPLVTLASAFARHRIVDRPALRCIAAFAAATAVLGIGSGFAVGDGAPLSVWRDCIANLAAHSRWYFSNQISLRSLLLVDPAATLARMRAGWDESAWLREREHLDAATRGTLLALRVVLCALVGRRLLALSRDRGEPWRGLGVASLLPFVLLYPANYYFALLGLAFLCDRAERRLVLALVVVNMLAFLLAMRWSAPDAIEMRYWAVSLLLLGALAVGTGIPRRRSALAAGIAVLLVGVGYDAVRRSAPATTWDLAAADVTTRGARAVNLRTATWGSAWSRNDQVSLVATGAVVRATAPIVVPEHIGAREALEERAVDLRVELTAAPFCGIVALDLDGASLGTVDLFSPFPRVRAFVATGLRPARGPHTLGLTVVGAEAHASGSDAGIDRIVLQPARARDAGNAAEAGDLALRWVLAHPADLFDGGRKDVLRELVALERLRDDERAERAATERLATLNGYRGDWALTPEAEALVAGAHAARRLGAELDLLAHVGDSLREWSRLPYTERAITRPFALRVGLARLEGRAGELSSEGSALDLAGRALLVMLERPHDRRDAARFAKLVSDVTCEIGMVTDLGREPAGDLPLSHADLERILGEGLVRALELGDVLTTARLVLASRELGIAVEARQDALRFLLEQQTEDGSFGACDPSAPNPARETVLTALLALTLAS